LDNADTEVKGRTKSTVIETPAEALDSNVSYEDLMSRIRHIVLTQRLRVNEFFEDYDPLRCGSISKGQFRRGLGMLGLSKLGLHDINDGQFKLLCDMYQDAQKRDQVQWTKFFWDVQSGESVDQMELLPSIS
jgi:hypothetical protein